MVQRLHRLRHDAVVGRDHQDRDVGHLRTTGTHGGERLVTGGVDEGDGALDAVVLGPDLVRTDVLGDATRLVGDHVGLADRVEELRLTVIDVTHDGHDRRTDLEVFVVLVLELLLEVDVEALEQLLVFVLGADDLDLVAQLVAEDAERGVVERLGRGRHLTEVEQRRHERTRLHRVLGQDLELVGQIADRCAAAHADDLAAVAARDRDAAERRSIAHLEFGALRPLRLAGAALAATAAEGTCGTTAGAAATAAAATGTAGEAAAAPGAPPGRRRDAGSRHRHRRDDRRRRDAAGRARRRGDLRRRARRDAERRDGAPPGRGAAGRGMAPPAPPGRGMPWLPANGLLPGRGAPGRDMPCALANGLLPGRGPPAGRAASPSASALAAGAAGAAGRGGALGAAASAGAAAGASASAAGAGAGRGGGLEAAGFAAGRSFGFSGALMPSASSAAFSRRATGGAMLEEALLTNSPMSLSLSSAILLSMPRSAATSCTRGLATFLLSGVHPDQERTIKA